MRRQSVRSRPAALDNGLGVNTLPTMKNGPYELVIAPDGYPGMKYRNRYAYEHHVVWWRHTGRLPASGCVIHHVDENKRHNDFSNLEEMPMPRHSREHTNSRSPPRKAVCCGWCNREFVLGAGVHRTRSRQSSTGRLYCSRQHQVLKQQSEARALRGGVRLKNVWKHRKVHQLKRTGATNAEIVAVVGCTTHTVSRWLKIIPA